MTLDHFAITLRINSIHIVSSLGKLTRVVTSITLPPYPFDGGRRRSTLKISIIYKPRLRKYNIKILLNFRHTKILSKIHKDKGQ